MPLFTTLPNALGHFNSLFAGDNWAKCSTVMYPVWLLVACFSWWIGLLFGQRFWGNYFSVSPHTPICILTQRPSSGKHFSLLLNKTHRNKGKQKQAIRGQAPNKRVASVLEQCKENHLFEHKRRLRGTEPGATSASLDCGPKWQLTAAALTSWASRCGGNFPKYLISLLLLVPLCCLPACEFGTHVKSYYPLQTS